MMLMSLDSRLLATVILLALAEPAFAQQGNPNTGQGDSFASGGNVVLAKTLASVASMHDMQGGRWIFEVAPGYWQGDLGGLQCGGGSQGSKIACAGSGSLQGWTLGAAAKREFSRHWGFGLLAGLTQQTGSVDLTTPNDFGGQVSFPGGAGFAGGTFHDLNAQFVGAQLTFDPFSGPEGIRMPISVGPMWASFGAKFDHSFINPSTSKPQTESFDTKKSDFGLFFDASLDIPVTQWFRVMPGILLGSIAGDQQQITYNVSSNGTQRSQIVPANNDNSLGCAFFSILYRPWNLSFNFDMPIGDLRTWAVYSLRWKHTL